MSKNLNTVAKFAIATGVMLFMVIGTNVTVLASGGTGGSSEADPFVGTSEESSPSSSTPLSVKASNSGNTVAVPEQLNSDNTVAVAEPVNSDNTVAVPEPLTIGGSLVALGMGWKLKRKMKGKESSN